MIKDNFNDTTATTSPLPSPWNIGPQQLSSSEAVVDVSVEFKLFKETGFLAPCSNPEPGGPGLHIYIPWRLVGPVIPPGTEYPFYSPFTICMGYSGTIFFPDHHTKNFKDTVKG
jgi:hypothetical protein